MIKLTLIGVFMFAVTIIHSQEISEKQISAFESNAEHKSQAYANNPGNERDWRASCWEIHPITYIKVLD